MATFLRTLGSGRRAALTTSKNRAGTPELLVSSPTAVVNTAVSIASLASARTSVSYAVVNETWKIAGAKCSGNFFWNWYLAAFWSIMHADFWAALIVASPRPRRSVTLLIG